MVVLNQSQTTGPATTRPLKLAGAPRNLALTAMAKLGNFFNLPAMLAVFRFPSQYVGLLFSASSAKGASTSQSDFEQFSVLVRPSILATSPLTSASPIPTVTRHARLAANWCRPAGARSCPGKEAGRPLVETRYNARICRVRIPSDVDQHSELMSITIPK